MKKLICLVVLIALTTTVQASELCGGSSEEKLICHSDEVKQFLRTWVTAWGTGDIDTYLALYTSARSPRDDLSRAEWESHRRARISPQQPVEINLKLESMGLEDSGLFDVVFLQSYRSATYQDQVRKRLFLLREKDELRIWKEEVLLSSNSQ